MEQGLAQAIAYIRVNKDKFPIDALKEQLAQAGYPQAVIEAAAQRVFASESVPPAPSVAMGFFDAKSGMRTALSRSGFWDFRTPRNYDSLGAKLLDFFLGLFGVAALYWIFFGPLQLLVYYLGLPLPYPLRSFSLGAIAVFVVHIIGIVYFLRRRRYLAYGLLAAFLLPIVLIAALYALFYGGAIFY